MRATGLTARIVYALAAAPVACVGGFYAGVFLFTRVVPSIEGVPESQPGWTEFLFSLLVGLAAGFTAFFYALTLPRMRLRRRGGRGWRMAASAVLVLLAAMAAETEGVPLRYVAGLMLWLSVTLTFTFIRYGVLDRRHRSRT